MPDSQDRWSLVFPWGVGSLMHGNGVLQQEATAVAVLHCSVTAQLFPPGVCSSFCLPCGERCRGGLHGPRAVAAHLLLSQRG